MRDDWASGFRVQSDVGLLLKEYMGIGSAFASPIRRTAGTPTAGTSFVEIP